MKWIKFSEQKPEEDMHTVYLFYDFSDDCIEFVSYYNGRILLYNDGDGMYPDPLLDIDNDYWMPLPEKPHEIK